MTRHPLFRTCLVFLPVIAFGVMLVVEPAAAQDLFGGVQAQPAEVEPPAEEQKAAENAPLPTDDPVVLAIRESNPTTPVELAEAIDSLRKLGQLGEARTYLAKLLAAVADEAAMAALHRKMGSHFFFRLSQEKELQPQGRQVADAVLKAAYRAARNPDRIAKLISQLRDPDAAVRRAAMVDLRQADTAAVAPLVRVLADPNRGAEHARVRDALVALDLAAVEPLIGALQTPDEALRAQVIEVLGRLRAQRATPYLIRPYLSSQGEPALGRAAETALLRIVGHLPGRREAELYLAGEAQSFFDGKLPLEGDLNDMVRLWHWDRQSEASVPRRYLASDAALVVAAGLSRDLYALWPEKTKYRRLYLATTLETAKTVGGLDRPLDDAPGSVRRRLAAVGAEALDDLLAYAMKTDHVPAAIGAAEVLGDIGDVDLLLSENGRPRPLARALCHRSRRLRFAAAEAIMKIDPRQTFPGSSRLVDTLGYLARAAGVRRALIGHPRTAQAQTWVGMLLELGFEADTAATGRRLFQLAVNSPDYELVLVSDAIDRPAIEELHQMLRRDRRTGSLPIGLMIREEKLKLAQTVAERDPLTEAFPQPQDRQAMAFQVRRLLSRAGRHAILGDERRRHAERALGWLAQLAAGQPGKYRFYDVLGQQESVEAALFAPGLASPAAKVLGLLGSAGAQRALVDLASRNAGPLADRRAAAAAFQTAVARRGLLLTTTEIRRQYARYNESEQLDRETQNVLASILDAIEAPSRRQE